MNNALLLITIYALKSLFSLKKTVLLSTLLNILTLLIFFLYGLVFSYLIILSNTSQEIKSSLFLTLPYINVSFFLINLSKGIFPAYSKYHDSFANGYPLSIFQKTVYEFTISSISIRSISIFIFFIPSILYFSDYSILFVFILSLIFFSWFPALSLQPCRCRGKKGKCRCKSYLCDG